MKLRNKKTGEIIDIYKGEITLHYNQGRKTIHFKHLEDLEEWEDVPEEPKEWWYIDIHGPHKVTNDDEYYQQVKAASKEIGNYFETKEEAEQAVKRLRAWKRLKDKGFEFKDFVRLNDCAIAIRATSDESWSEICDELDICFGGEE